MKLAQKFSLGIGTFVVLTTVAFTLFARDAVERVALPAGLEQLAAQVQLVTALLDERVADVQARLLALRDSPLVEDVRDSGQDPTAARQARTRLAAFFAAGLEADPFYLALYYVAADARHELVRVERTRDRRSVRRVPDAELRTSVNDADIEAGLALGARAVHVSTRAGGATPLQHYVTPLHDQAGKVSGVLVLALDASSLVAPFHEQPAGQVAYLVDARGGLLSAPLGRRSSISASSQQLQDELPQLGDALRARSRWRGALRDARGHMLAVACAPVRDGGLFAVITAPQASLLAAVRLMETRTLWVGGAALLLSWCLAWYLARSLIRPLAALTQQVEAFGRGEPQPGAAVGNDDELAVLARAWERMSRQVREQQKVLQEQLVEREEAERRALREAQRLEFMGAVIDSSDDAIITKDLSGTITSWNPAAERLFGYRADEVIGKSIQLIVPPERRQEVKEILSMVARGERVSHHDTERMARDGRLIPVSLTISPVRAPGGLIVGASKIATDVSARVRSERELALQREKLERSNAALLEFAYVASHDLQEPLRMVASFTQLLGERYRGRLDAQADKYIQFATDGALRMQRLIRDMLAYARAGAEPGPLMAVDCSVVLREVLLDLQPHIHEVSGKVEVVGVLPWVLGDATQLRQLFQNLIGNALKFRGERTPHVRVYAEREGDAWDFSVEDNGIGIDEAFGERVFGMFQRLHPRDSYDGSGIGLSIAKRIVERHGGRIWFRSQPGVGTTFEFTLHAADEHSNQLQASA